MGVLGVARLFACKALWQGAGVNSAGHALLKALGSPEADVRTVAGMFLVQAGQRAVPLIREALEQGRYLPMILTIAADIGAEELAPQIRRFIADSDPTIARAAREALELLASGKSGEIPQSP
jgi:HEAT repeat protein